jgi:hypothetical protein
LVPAPIAIEPLGKPKLVGKTANNPAAVVESVVQVFPVWLLQPEGKSPELGS